MAYVFSMGGLDIYQKLKEQSILLLGERYPSKIVWVQLHNTSEQSKEDEMRKILLEVNSHIMKGRLKAGSARKFLDGKLLYYSIDRIPGEQTRDKVICLYTLDQSIGSPVKKAIEAVAYRGGAFSVYSAQRFFSEMIDLLEDPDKLNQEAIPLDKARQKIDEFDAINVSVNELGQLISIINRSLDMDSSTLEKLYFLVYESIEALEHHHGDGHDHDDDFVNRDPDEFLDAAYIIARKYQESGGFHLALELFKKLIPFTQKNSRFDLEIACRIRIAMVYEKYFPSSGNYILDVLFEIDEDRLHAESKRSDIEMYYCLMGIAHNLNDDIEQSIIQFNHAIEESEGVLSSPLWIAEAYKYLGQYDESKFMFINAIRQYLTAATISFHAGDLIRADSYTAQAANVEIKYSLSLIHTALVAQNEGLIKPAEYRVWESLRTLIKSYVHVNQTDLRGLERSTQQILQIAEMVLQIPGKIRRNKSILRRIGTELEDIRVIGSKTVIEMDKLFELSSLINDNIPLPPPTFILLTLDGRLIIMGKIKKEKWENSPIKGVLLSGILSAIMSLISEVSDQKTALKTVDAGNFQILFEQSENLAAALLVDRDIPVLRQGLISILTDIDENYGGQLKYWDGFNDPVLFKNLKKYAVNYLSINSAI